MYLHRFIIIVGLINNFIPPIVAHLINVIESIICIWLRSSMHLVAVPAQFRLELNCCILIIVNVLSHFCCFMFNKCCPPSCSFLSSTFCCTALVDLKQWVQQEFFEMFHKCRLYKNFIKSKHKYACSSLRQRKWQKSCLHWAQSYKTMLTLMDQQSNRVCSVHEHVRSVRLSWFVPSTLTHGANSVRCDAVQAWACSIVFPTLETRIAQSKSYLDSWQCSPTSSAVDSDFAERFSLETVRAPSVLIGCRAKWRSSLSSA